MVCWSSSEGESCLGVDWVDADFLGMGGVWARRGETRSRRRAAARDEHMRGFYTKGEGVLAQRAQRAEHRGHREEKEGRERAPAQVTRELRNRVAFGAVFQSCRV